MASWATEGIILKRNDSSEADKILLILTRRLGTIRAVAKGVKRVTSRRAPNLELFNYTKLFFSETKGLPILTEAVSIETFPELKSDLNKISYAYRLAEVVDRLFPEEQENNVVFETVLEALRQINTSSSFASMKLISLGAEMKLLASAGYRPQLFVCSRCGNPLNEQSHLLSPEYGGVIDRCTAELTPARPVSVEAIKVLRFILDQGWEEIGRLSIAPLVHKEVEQSLLFYLEYILEKGLASTKFINKLESI